MGREKYPVTKIVRMTEAEALLLKEKAEKLHMKEAEYVRFLLHDKPIEHPEMQRLVKQLINEVNHIGNNINQITKQWNAGIGNSHDKTQLFAHMQRIQEEIQKVVKLLGNQ